MKRIKLWLLCGLLLLSGCNPSPPAQPPEPPAATEPPSRVIDEPSLPEPAIREQPRPANYVRDLADGILKDVVPDRSDPVESVRATYIYLIENVFFADPVGLDMWQYRSDQTQPPTYVENRALSPLAFGVGSCEDFAAAQVVLLEQMGFEAMYVAGFTISVEGDYVDHAWAVVKLPDGWYHIDPQLEQNVIRNDTMAFRYFLRSDSQMVTDHKWGENLIEYWPGITLEDARNIRDLYTPPLCENTMESPKAITLKPPAKPDITVLKAKLNQERQAAGSRPPVPLNVDPPVLIGPATR